MKTDDVATRQNHLRLKGRLETVAAGVELLKGRRKALTKEFVDLIEECIEQRAVLSRLLAKGRRGLELARALNHEPLASLIHASSRKITLEIKTKNIWGVNIPEIQEVPVVRHLDARGVSPVGVNAGLVDVAKSFESIMDKVVKMASMEVRAKRVGEMIRSDTRKINAIDEFMIPMLSSRIKYISRVLEEREREEVFRLKRYKSRKSVKSSC